MDYANSGSKPEVKAEWARQLMQRMDQLLEPQTCVQVREGCACVLSNDKSIYACTFRKLRKLYPEENQYLDEVVKYLNATSPLRRCGQVSREGERITALIAGLSTLWVGMLFMISDIDEAEQAVLSGTANAQMALFFSSINVPIHTLFAVIYSVSLFLLLWAAFKGYWRAAPSAERMEVLG